MSFFEELKRRNVVRVGIAYAVASWLILQVADILVEAFEAPTFTMRIILLILLIGLPLALFFAWAYELTPEGLKKESEVDRSQSITNQTGRKLDFTIIFVLVVALGYFAYDKFILRTGESTLEPQVAAEVAPAEAPASSLPTDKSIAVLPFENRSMNEEDKFFTSGIHDDLLTQLAQVSSLRVISRTSVVQFEETDKTIREIAELLNVAYVLEGGVQRAGDQVRINLQLIDAATDAHLWAQTYDRELTANNVFAIQSEITTAVTDAMRATLTPEEVERIADVPTENMEALEEYFKGRAEMDTRTLPALESARLRFERARTLDPEFAQAYAGETQAILLLSDRGTSYGDIPAAETVRLGRPLMEKAYELAPDDPQVLAVYGLLERQADNFELSVDYYDRSLAIDPSNGEVLNWKRMNLPAMGRIDESIDIALKIVEVDPLSMIGLYNSLLTIDGFGDGSPELVAELLDRLEQVDVGKSLDARGLVAERGGRLPDAARNYDLSLIHTPDSSSLRATLGNLLARLGLYDEARLVDREAGEYVPFFRQDWEENLRLAQEDLARSPEGLNEQMRVLGALNRAGQHDEVMVLAQALWDEYGNNPSQLSFMNSMMAVSAQATERPVEFRTYRDAYALWMQTFVEADFNGNFINLHQARLAAIDQRHEVDIAAMTRAIDEGMRWAGWFTDPVFDDLADTLAFRTEMARMVELAEADRSAILDLLCAPDSELAEWDSAPETCQMWEDRRRPAIAAPT